MHPLRKKPLSYFLFALVFFSVKCSQDNATERSYYYWRNSNSITTLEKDFIRNNDIEKIYKKVLDIDWNNTMGAFPVSSNDITEFNYQLNYIDLLKVNLVPVVFITNKTFINAKREDFPQLALRIIRRCLPAYDSVDVDYESRHKTIARNYYYKPKEIQFDCDWTDATKGNYFYFLETVKSLIRNRDIQISATIRLHQYKYDEKTGVPPVDRGMLMVYNISNPIEKTALNSIFDYNRAKEYFVSNKKYPIPLDIGLPAYSWSIVFRDDKFYQIENDLSNDELKTCSFLQQLPDHYFKVKQDTVFRDMFLRIGDEIKSEAVDGDLLKDAAKLSRKAINAKSFSVSLFELSSDEIKNYDHETLQAVYTSFK